MSEQPRGAGGPALPIEASGPFLLEHRVLLGCGDVATSAADLHRGRLSVFAASTANDEREGCDA